MTAAAVLPLLYIAAVTPALVRVDVAEHRLPNRIVLPGLAIAAVSIGAAWVAEGRFPMLGVISGASYFAFLLLLNLLGGMGMGDVKLAALLGAAAGLSGPVAAVFSPVLAFTLGGITSVALLARGRRGRRIAFGPFMLAGFWVAVLLGLLAG